MDMQAIIKGIKQLLSIDDGHAVSIMMAVTGEAETKRVPHLNTVFTFS